METFLPPMQAPQVNSLKRYFGILAIFLLSYQATFGQNVDLTISDLSLTAVDETNFIYAFSLVNNGTDSRQGYSMKLTFSANQSIDGGDFFVLTIPSTTDAAQFIGPTQTLLKSEHFFAASSTEFLPTGTWYVIAEINYDNAFGETTYANNQTVSTNTITVDPYQISFTEFPVVSSVTESSFSIDAVFDARTTRIYYLYQMDGLPAPDVSQMESSNGLFSWQPSVVVSGLGPAVDYDVYFLAESYDGNVSAVYKIDVKTLGSADPTIILSKDELTLFPTSTSAESLSERISITGYHLTSNLIITPSAGFVVSKDDLAYVDQVSFLASDFDDGMPQVFYVKSVPETTEGVKSGTITSTSGGAETKTINLSVTVFNPKVSNFNGTTSLDESGWIAYSVTGRHTWMLVDLAETSSTGENMAVQIDGSAGGNAPNEDWLISPSIDLSTFTYHPTLKFKSYSAGPGETLTLKYSADYTGYGDPRDATWLDTDAEFPAVNSAEWITTFVELANRENSIHFAYVYQSTESLGSKWIVDDFKISDNLVDIPTDVLVYQGVPAGTFSASQSMDIDIAGYGDVTVAASAGFQVSTDNVVFSSSVTIPENEAATGATIYIRFTPVAETDNFPGTLTFTANDFSVTRNTLVGSSSITTAAEKGISNSGFIYPNPTEGTVHIDLNTFDNASPIVPVSVSSSMGATIIYFESSVSGLDSKLTDVLTNLAPGIYYITVKSKGSTYRNKLVRK